MSATLRGRALMLVVLAFSMVLSACDSTPAGPIPSPTAAMQVASTPLPVATRQAGGNTPVAPNRVGPANTVAPTAATPTAAPANPSSADKIAAAEAAGKIDHDTALLYTLYDAYAPANLPSEYRGDDTKSLIEGTTLFAELNQRMGQMPAGVKAKVQPFMLRPDNPQSFWYQSAASASVGGGAHLAAPALAGPKWTAIDSSSNARVWYDQSNDPNGKSKAQLIANAVDNDIWDKEQQAMLGHEPCSDLSIEPNGGDGRLDIYLGDVDSKVFRFDSQGLFGTLPASAEGVDIPENESVPGCGEATFIILKTSLDDEALKVAAAHEVFHAFQFSFKLGSEYNWWMEASATWAEDLVYPDNNDEQGYLTRTWALATPTGPLDKFVSGGTSQYGAYIWPFYLTRGKGDYSSEIGQLFKDSEGKRPIDVMHDRPGWESDFKQFALWNLNQENTPTDKYRDDGQRIDKLNQNITYVGSRGGNIDLNSSPQTLKVNLPHASVAYYGVNFVDDGPGFVEKLRFDLSDLQGKEGAGVQAVIFIGDSLNPGKVYTEDWSGQGERSFCREQHSEFVTQVMLVVSNSSVKADNKLAGNIKVEATNQNCQTGNGSIAYMMNSNYHLSKGSDSAQANASENLNSQLQVNFLYAMPDDAQQTSIYAFTSTNDISIHGTGTGKSGDDNFSTNVSYSLDGGGTSHNPPQQGEVAYKKLHQYDSGEQPTSEPDTLPPGAGQISTFKQDGQDMYDLTYVPSGIAASYTRHLHHAGNCQPDSGIWTTDQDETNASLSASNTGCAPNKDSYNRANDNPDLFGFIGLKRPANNGYVLRGTYNAASGVIDGHESLELSDCSDIDSSGADGSGVAGWIALMGAFESGNSISDEGWECHMHYDIQWHIQLPPQK